MLILFDACQGSCRQAIAATLASFRVYDSGISLANLGHPTHDCIVEFREALQIQIWSPQLPDEVPSPAGGWRYCGVGCRRLFWDHCVWVGSIAMMPWLQQGEGCNVCLYCANEVWQPGLLALL